MHSVKRNKIIFGILVTYNPVKDDFLNVVKSISPQVDELFIIDNGSKNMIEVSEIAKDFKNINFECLDTNLGLAVAQNIGIRKALDRGADYFILFDQDSVIVNNFVTNLHIGYERLMDQNVKVGAVGPLFYDKLSGEAYPATIYWGPFIKREHLDVLPVEATFIIASGCLISKDVLLDIGLMKDELFIDYVDVEWCLRAKSKGYRIFIIPSAKMAHSIGDHRISLFGRTISVHSPLRRYYLIRNSFYMMRLHYVPLGYKLREMVFNFARLAISVTTSKAPREVIRYAICGIKDGFNRQYGAYRNKK